MNIRGWNKRWLWLGVTLGLLALLGSLSVVLAQGPGGQFSNELTGGGGDATGFFTYQGQLVDGGQPANGVYDFRFVIYDSDVNGNVVGGPEWKDDLTVSRGLFAVNLAPAALNTIFTGSPRWMQVEVRPGSSTGAYTVLPRQPIMAVPYAWSLRPGAVVTGYMGSGNFVLNLENTDPTWGGGLSAKSASGVAVSATSPDGIPIMGYSQDGYAVYGYDGGSTQARGYAGYFDSYSGIGVYGHSSAQAAHPNSFAPGVYGRSENGAGVYGVGDDDSGAWTASGVYGESDSGNGVVGNSTSGYGGSFYSRDLDGLSARTSSATAYGARINNYNGSGYPGLYVNGTLYVSGAKTGYVVDVAINDGDEPLETGDVVMITGYADPVSGDIPVIRVRKADAAGTTRVAGVVDQPFAVPAGWNAQAADSAETVELPHVTAETAVVAKGTGIAPGGYLTLVTLGSYRMIRVDASSGPIQPGDLLVASSRPGYAMKAISPQIGSIIGKAMGELLKGEGFIPVLITMD